MGGKVSAGLLLYRRSGGEIEVLVGHMGGPFWARKDDGAWSIPKGELEPGEEPMATADREFVEELGAPVPHGDRLDLGSIKQSGGKIVHAWAIEGDLDPATIVPGTFELEWPRGSGRIQVFPELDRVAWMSLVTAEGKLVTAQRTLLERLRTLVEL